MTAYLPGDFRTHLEQCAEAGGGFIVSAPFVKGFYEGWFKFINQNVSWQEPPYDVWNPDDFPKLLDHIDELGVPYIAVYKTPLEGRHTACYYRKGMHPPFYVLTRAEPRSTSIVDQPPSINAKPFAFKALDIAKLTATSEVSISPCQQGYADYIKGLYLQENITFTSGMANFLIHIDGMLAGVMTFSKLTANMVGGWHGRNSIYMLSDVSTTRFGRVSKLIAMLATSTTLLDYISSRMVHRPILQVVTTVRSNNPVSMKYRGIYDVLSRKEGDDKTSSGAGYVINYGSAPRDLTPQQIYAEWFKKHFRDDRERKVTNSYAPRKEEQRAAGGV